MLFRTLMGSVALSSILFAGALEDTLTSQGSFEVSGTFAQYDFEGVDTAFDWVFALPNGDVYQLQGVEPSESSVFGWAPVDVTPVFNESSWKMSYIGDWNNDGDSKFDWILVSADGSLVYKLAGVTDSGNFDYEGPISVPAKFVGDTIVFGEMKSETVSGDITSNTAWSADTVYTLTGKVKVKNGATLTIEPGTTIIGDTSAYLVVTAGSKLMAEGTADAPIIFTSVAAYNGAPEGRGQWGGLTLLGNAQTNEAGLVYEVDEADADFAFGSTSTANNGEDSGTLTFVEVRNSGLTAAENKEVNGLSLCGIGSGTTISDITVVNSGDDGIELWGGTVDMSNLTIINAGDDSFDVDNGYNGTVTNLNVVQIEEAAGGIEMTNSGDATIVRTNPTINGFTITTAATQKKEGGIYFKDEGVTATFKNGAIIHNGTGGALHSKNALSTDAANLVAFENVTIENATGEDDYQGGAAAQLQTAFEAQ